MARGPRKPVAKKKEEAPKKKITAVTKMEIQWLTESTSTFVVGEEDIVKLMETSDQLLVFYPDGLVGVPKTAVKSWRVWVQEMDVE